MRRVGIDVGTYAICVAVWEDGKCRSWIKFNAPKNQEWMVRVGLIFLAFKRWLEEVRPDCVAIEDSAIKGYAIAHQLARVVGVLCAACIDTDTPFHVVPSSAWKKEVLGNGRADKAVALEYCKNLGLEIKDHNLADAVCIAEYCLRKDEGLTMPSL